MNIVVVNGMSKILNCVCIRTLDIAENHGQMHA